MSRSNLSPSQITQFVYDPVAEAFKTVPSGGSLVTEQYDEIVLTYILVGNGAGQIGTVTYKLSGNTVATLTLTYDSSNRLSDVLRS